MVAHRRNAGILTAADLFFTAWLTVLFLLLGAPRDDSPARPPTPTTCQEDDPCWDWRTMGNQQRGICLAGVNVLESADGALSLGGRGCDAG